MGDGRPQAPLEPVRVRELLTLRALLDQGLATARLTSDLKRLTAVVLLDAANERALHLVAVAEGLPVGVNTKFDDMLQRVRQHLGDRWEPRAVADVRRLHRARNSVQHEGLGADREDVAPWAASTTQFVVSLVEAAFSVSLPELRLSGALRTPEIRAHFEDAERALGFGAFDQSVESCQAAFRIARDDWMRRHRRRGYGVTHRPFRDEIWGQQAFEYLESLATQARDAALLYPLAADPGDVQWFVELAKHPETATAEDAVRALGFVFWWVVNWEALSPVEGDRVSTHLRNQRASRATPDAQARVSRATLEWRYGEPVLDLALSDVPADSDYDTWARAVPRYINESEGLSGRPHLNEAGRLTLRLPNDGSADVEAVLRAVQAALIAADDALREERERERVETLEFERDAEEWARDAAEVPWPDWLGSASLTRETLASGRSRGVALVIREENRHVERTARDRLLASPQVAQCYWGSTGQLVVEPVVPAATMREILESVDEDVRALVTQASAERQAAAESFDELKQRLRMASASLGIPVTFESSGAASSKPLTFCTSGCAVSPVTASKECSIEALRTSSPQRIQRQRERASDCGRGCFGRPRRVDAASCLNAHGSFRGSHSSKHRTSRAGAIGT